jgi:hypothetical protein
MRCQKRIGFLIAVAHDNRLSQGIVGAQTKGQFHMIYGSEGTQALFTGLATQIVYGGCDHDTADFYSKASGTTTADANPHPTADPASVYGCTEFFETTGTRPHCGHNDRSTAHNWPQFLYIFSLLETFYTPVTMKLPGETFCRFNIVIA